MQTRRIKSKYTKEDAINTIDRNINWINSADNKSSILLGVFSFVFSNLIINFDLDKIQQMFYSGNSDVWFRALLLTLFLIALWITILATPILLILVILSRTKSSMDKPKKNLSFFSDIATQKYDDFRNLVSEISEDEVMDDLISQVYITSKITSIKYKFLHLGYTSFIIYFICTFIYIWLISV